MTNSAPPIDVLVADDERPARDELVHLLRTDTRVGEILTATSGAEALRLLSERAVRIAFLDIHMPGLTGMELARSLLTLAEPPAVVFVTADEAKAVEAFELRAADYLLKPVRLERLRQAVDRVVERGDAVASGDDEVLPVTVGSVVRFVRRSDVRWVRAQGTIRGCTPATAQVIWCASRSRSWRRDGRGPDSCASIAPRSCARPL